MVTYFASATATSAKTAQFQFRQSTVVTASASATATSTLSQAHADQIAQQTAQQIADNTAENEANLMMQTVDVTTVGDTIFGLDSSLLSKFIKKVGDNSWSLGENFTVPDGLNLRIRDGDTLDIPNGVTFSIGSRSKLTNNGTLNVQGDVTVGDSNGLQNTDVINIIPTENTTLAPATAITNTVQNNGIINISSGASYTVNADTLFTNSSIGTINNSGTIVNAGTIKNDGIVYNYGKIQIDTGCTFNNDTGVVNENGVTLNSGTITGDRFYLTIDVLCRNYQIPFYNGWFYNITFSSSGNQIYIGRSFNDEFIPPVLVGKIEIPTWMSVNIPSGKEVYLLYGYLYVHGVLTNNGSITFRHDNIYYKSNTYFQNTKVKSINNGTISNEGNLTFTEGAYLQNNNYIEFIEPNCSYNTVGTLSGIIGNTIIVK